MWIIAPQHGSASTRQPARRIFPAMTVTVSDRPGALLSRVEAYAGTVLMIGASTLLGLWIGPRWGTAPVDMIYLPAVLAAAALWGLGPGLAAGIGAALAYNFFFTEPVHTFRIDRVADIVTVIVLLIVALVTSRLAASIRAQARIAAAHAARNATVAGFAGKLLSSSGESDIGDAACAELSRLFDCNVAIVAGLPQPRMIATVPGGNQLTPSDIAAAALTLESGEPAGRGTYRLQPAEWVFHAVRSSGANLAAVGLARDDGGVPVPEERLELLGGLLDQLALALERERLEREAREFAATRQRDRVRAVLLSSIGEDLRPRIAAIANASKALRRSGTDDREMVSAIASQVSKLDQYVANILDLGVEQDEQPIEAGDITIDLFRRAVTRNGKPVHLTPKEFAVLAELARQRGRVLTHAHLLRSVWGPAQEGQVDYLRVAVRALRQKLEEEPSAPRLILNEPGVGYQLSLPC
jgi:two-component system sensor histidine kinase KdpD